MPFRIHDWLKAKWNLALRLVLASALFAAIAIAPLRAQTYTDLYDFNCTTGGCNPIDFGQLTQGPDGNLYGTTSGFGTNGVGTIFMITPSGTYRDLVQFNGTNGATPEGGLALASDGNYYGTTVVGGSGYGLVFRFTPPSTVKVLHIFDSTHFGPLSPPVQAKDGNLYGATISGTIYRISLPSGTYEQLPHNTPGFLFGPLFLASDGNLYGATISGDPSGPGTVFRMTTAGVVTVLHNFTGSGGDGSLPYGPLTQGSDGNLYGTTRSGGVNNSGMVFRLSLAGTFTNIHSFDGYQGSFGTNNDGGGSLAGLLAASDGILYGVNSLGGSFGSGTLFQITQSGTFTKLHDFGDPSSFGSGPSPFATLMQHTNGTFYGTTYDGFVPTGTGNLFSVTPITRIPTVFIEGPIWLKSGVPVEILGNNLDQVSTLSFAGVPAQFRVRSATNIVAQVPSNAIDGVITATYGTGLQVMSQKAMHILPSITSFSPSSGPVGTQVTIVGGGFAGASKVTFGGGRAASFNVLTPNMIQATVPSGAKTSRVNVVTPNGTGISSQTFTVN